ncbi:MAG: hypothetical protein RBT80_28640 [Candidatus Vecturithrix sp.]|jgi:hypothetical protein|nr:hypothetical protein [Candidatus Vecturithrix sp.]
MMKCKDADKVATEKAKGMGVVPVQNAERNRPIWEEVDQALLTSDMYTVDRVDLTDRPWELFDEKYCGLVWGSYWLTPNGRIIYCSDLHERSAALALEKAGLISKIEGEIDDFGSHYKYWLTQLGYIRLEAAPENDELCITMNQPITSQQKRMLRKVAGCFRDEKNVCAFINESDGILNGKRTFTGQKASDDDEKMIEDWRRFVGLLETM